MDVCTGYFGRIHLSTESLVSVPFARSLVSLANGQSAHETIEQLADVDGDAVGQNAQATIGLDDTFWDFNSSGGAFDPEDWGIFLRTTSFDMATPGDLSL